MSNALTYPGPDMMQQMGQVETVDMLIPQDKVGLVIGWWEFPV